MLACTENDTCRVEKESTHKKFGKEHVNVEMIRSFI